MAEEPLPLRTTNSRPHPNPSAFLDPKNPNPKMNSPVTNDENTTRQLQYERNEWRTSELRRIRTAHSNFVNSSSHTESSINILVCQIMTHSKVAYPRTYKNLSYGHENSTRTTEMNYLRHCIKTHELIGTRSSCCL